MRDSLVMVPRLEVILAFAFGLASLFASGCAPSEPVPLVRPGEAGRHINEATPGSEQVVRSVPSTSAIPVAASTQRPPTATRVPSPTLIRSPSPSVVLPTPSPMPSPEPASTEYPAVVTRTGAIQITIVYDNNAYDERLKTAWGFSCLVEWDDLTLLFDTGGDVPTLLSNMGELSLDPTEIDIVVLSHIHGDHVGGLWGILDVNKGATVYLPRSFPGRLKRRVGSHAQVVEVREAMPIAEGIYTTGEMRGGVIEQSLVLATSQGLVVITGCAHPGIVRIIERAREIALPEDGAGGEVHLAMGGFHLGGKTEAAIEGIVEDFQRLGVQKVAACHCSGELARSLFERAYGEDFIKAGVGSGLEVGG